MFRTAAQYSVLATVSMLAAAGGLAAALVISSIMPVQLGSGAVANAQTIIITK
jgi:hypothetical protein